MILVKTAKSLVDSDLELEYSFEYLNHKEWDNGRAARYVSNIINLRDINLPIAENIIISEDYGVNDGKNPPVKRVFDGLNRLNSWKLFFDNKIPIRTLNGDIFFSDFDSRAKDIILNNIKFNVSIISFTDKERQLFNYIFNDMHYIS